MRWPRFRTQALLVLVLLATLPVFAWFAAREIEQFLRSAEERALVAVATSLVQALRAEDAVPGDGRDRLYVQRIAHPQTIDGFGDDWAQWIGQGQRFASPSGALSVEVLLATDNRRLFGLLNVSDSTSGLRRSRTEAGTDEIVLRLSDGLDYHIGPGQAPGTAEVTMAGSPQPVGTTIVHAAWRDRSVGQYQVEFRIPISLGLPTMAIGVRDYRGSGVSIDHAGTVVGGGLEPWPLLLRSARWSERLTEVVAAGQRAWIVDSSGHVVAVGGELARRREGAPTGWRGLVYRLLSDGSTEAAEGRDPVALLKLNDGEITTAMRGHPAVRWRAASDGSILASVAVPLSHRGRSIGALVLESPADALLIVTNRVLAQTVLVALIALVLVALALVVIAAAQSIRIRRLSRAIAQVSERGLKRPLPEHEARDDIGELSREFTRLIAELGQYNAYLEQLAGRLAHELGTPLAVVRSSLDNIATFPVDKDIEPYLGRAQDGADRLRAILRALSEARRLEQAISVAEMERVDLRSMVELMFSGYRELDSEHAWELSCSDGELVVEGAGDLLAQALDKLVDNARGFAPERGWIKLSVRREANRVILAVANQGPPLPKHMQRRIFESMISVRDASEKMHLGLGLHIVRLVAHAHGGGARAVNLPDGSGVRFEIVLPAKKAQD